MRLPDLSQLNALYVEDEILVALDGECILGDLGFGRVVVAHNLTDAMTALAGGGFDFALLDINLGNGETTMPIASHLSEREVPFVFATGYNPSENLVDHFDAPCLQKPFDENAVRSAVLDMLGESKKSAAVG